MNAAKTDMGRREWMGAALALWTFDAQAQPSAMSARVLREMQIHRVAELGLIIWVENQPPWDTQLVPTSVGNASFVAQSPDRYFPPAVLSYAAWPHPQVSADELPHVARVAIRRASGNFGLNERQSRALLAVSASYGVLQGFESDFAGEANGQMLDVKVFVGQAPDRFVLSLSAYTLHGRMPVLGEVLRRAWGQLRYL